MEKMNSKKKHEPGTTSDRRDYIGTCSRHESPAAAPHAPARSSAAGHSHGLGASGPTAVGWRQSQDSPLREVRRIRINEVLIRPLILCEMAFGFVSR